LDRLLGSRYVLHELLGRGAMGQVFRGSARADGEAVAVKVLRPELVSDPEIVARFLQERSILTSVSHRHVVRVLDLVVEGETAGIVMELVPGQDLRHLLSARRTLPPADAVYFARQLLEGAAAVHAAGIIHRDIKPENVLVDASADEVTLKLTDFGIARLSHGPVLTREPGLLGTPEYIAPEVADSALCTPAADLYSIGIMLYEMLAGRTPFAGGHVMAVLSRHVEQLPVPVPGARDDLWALVEWLLAKDPRSRPRSASEAAAAASRLEPKLAGEPALPPMPPLSEMPAPVMALQPARAAMSMATVGTGDPPRPALSENYPRVADATEVDHPATVVSRPAPQHHPDEDAAAGDKARYAAPPAPGRPAARPSDARRSRANRRLGIGAGAVGAVLLVVAAVLAVRGSRPSPAPAPAAAAAVSYTFTPEEYPDGLLIVRRWTLAGKHGSMLTETVSASSATGRALRVPFQDEIPKAVAQTTRTVVFTPAPAKIVKADPAVEWLLRLPSHGAVQVGYNATVPAQGATKARLMGLVKDFDALQAAIPATAQPHAVQLASLAIEPGAVQLSPRGSIQLALTGRLSNGQPAPQAVLGNAAWSSANPAVAGVASPGVVTGVSAGSTSVTAQIGSAQASVLVTVAAGPTRSSGTTRGAAAQKITFTSAPPSSPAVGLTYHVAASGGGSGNPVTFTVSSSVCSIAGATVTFNHPGSCVIDANQAGNAKYLAAAQVRQTITVGKGTQIISFTAPPAGPEASQTLSATGGASGNPVVFSVDASSGAGVCSVSGSTVSYLAKGRCVIDANQAGNTDYLAAAQVKRTIEVQTQVISFTALAAGSVGGSATLSATGGASGNPVVFSVDASSGAGVCSVSAGKVSYLAAGSCVIDANQAGNADYLAAAQVQQKITVS
jgi:serine/threonine-protein kinase